MRCPARVARRVPFEIHERIVAGLILSSSAISASVQERIVLRLWILDSHFLRIDSSVISAIKLQSSYDMSITRDDVLTVADVAALLDLKPYTVKEYARRAILPGRKLGRTWRFLRPELEEAIRHLPRQPE